VIDDIVSTDPWTVRGIEIRGSAEALEDVDPPRPGMSREVIRITPRRIVSWGITPGGLQSRG
jgi:pyridoxamine 5'-phosphate oxidase family protein